jgi:hypothetical protein
MAGVVLREAALEAHLGTDAPRQMAMGCDIMPWCLAARPIAFRCSRFGNAPAHHVQRHQQYSIAGRNSMT